MVAQLVGGNMDGGNAGWIREDDLTVPLLVGRECVRWTVPLLVGYQREEEWRYCLGESGIELVGWMVALLVEKEWNVWMVTQLVGR